MSQSIANEIERYLQTGDADPMAFAWKGGSLMDNFHQQHADLANALLEEVAKRAGQLADHAEISEDATNLLTRTKVEPMVRGLFPAAEQDTILAAVEKSVVFLNLTSLSRLVRHGHRHSSSWNLANLYLYSIGASAMAGSDFSVLGISEGTSCYVTSRYFSQSDPFSDFVVHEVAHIFHNCKRQTLNLPHKRRQEWLLDIAFRKRETFAYTCEVYSRILEQASTVEAKCALVEVYADSVFEDDERFDVVESLSILREAVRSRKGWKVIGRRVRAA